MGVTEVKKGIKRGHQRAGSLFIYSFIYLSVCLFAATQVLNGPEVGAYHCFVNNKDNNNK